MIKKTVAISEIKPNPNNPRTIKPDALKKLTKSIKEFHAMLEIRPIVVGSDMVVLGGNMRLKACEAAGLTEVPIIIADDLTEDQKKEFIIKDNVSGGEWDWDVLTDEWDKDLLEDWGLDISEIGGKNGKKDFSFKDSELGYEEDKGRIVITVELAEVDTVKAIIKKVLLEKGIGVVLYD